MSEISFLWIQVAKFNEEMERWLKISTFPIPLTECDIVGYFCRDSPTINHAQ